MSWQINAALRGNLKEAMALEFKAGSVAVTSVITRRTAKLKQDVRGAISGAGLGSRLPNTIRSRVFPNRGIDAKGRVESAAIYKRPGGLVDLITVFQEGATITAAGGRYLAIPIGAGKKESVKNLNRADIEIVPFRNRQGYVVLRKGSRAHGRGGGGVLFLLVKVAKIRKRLDLETIRAAAENGIDQEVADAWIAQASKLGLAD